MSVAWNPWHGCRRISEGCEHCYVYRIDSKFDRDSSEVVLNRDFFLPIAKKKNGEYKIPSGEIVYTCFSSDFFLPEADEWRREAWSFIAERTDLEFIIITKRIDRFFECLPEDIGNGYAHVRIGCTCENQKRADLRLPIFLAAPIKHRFIVCEPLLESIDLSAYLSDKIESVWAGGESGPGARVCDFAWVNKIREDCVRAGIEFEFHQTGANFRKDGRTYAVARKHQFSQAEKSGLSYYPDKK